MLDESEQRKLVVKEAVSWVGTRFHSGACKKGVGVACGPFLLAVHQCWLVSTRIDLPPLAKDWHFHTKQELFLNQVKKFCRSVSKPLAGDLVLFRLGSKDRPYSHGGIVVEWPNIIHSHFRSGVEYADATKDVLLNTASETSFWSPWSKD